MFQHSLCILGPQALIPGANMPTECIDLSNLMLAEVGAGIRVGMEDPSMETRLCQGEESRGDPGKLSRRLDIQKAKIRSKHRWMEAYKQGSQ